jgi:hypothetical protein
MAIPTGAAWPAPLRPSVISVATTVIANCSATGLWSVAAWCCEKADGGTISRNYRYSWNIGGTGQCRSSRDSVVFSWGTKHILGLKSPDHCHYIIFLYLVIYSINYYILNNSNSGYRAIPYPNFGVGPCAPISWIDYYGLRYERGFYDCFYIYNVFCLKFGIHVSLGLYFLSEYGTGNIFTVENKQF